MTFPRLRLRDEVATLLDLPWEEPLADWTAEGASFSRTAGASTGASVPCQHQPRPPKSSRFARRSSLMRRFPR